MKPLAPPRPPSLDAAAGAGPASQQGPGSPAPGGDTIIAIRGLAKTYASGQHALQGVDLDIRRGEIFALLGPNGAGKTTLIGIVCGIVRASAGSVTIGGHDIVRGWRAARALVGLVPQELTTDAFESVWDTVSFSRGLFGLRPDALHIERTLKALSLLDKKDAKVMTLSGGMKRRLLIAKALSHEPQVLFLDEPTAGVDVNLRRDMWALVRQLRERGTTVILTTHYIEEAEEMADRVGVIARGRLLLVDDKAALMRKLGKKALTVVLQSPLPALPPALQGPAVALAAEGHEIVYSYDVNATESGIAPLLQALNDAGIAVKDVRTAESSLEDIFVGLLAEKTKE